MSKRIVAVNSNCYHGYSIEDALEGVRVHVIKLVSVVGVHTGRGCQALQYFKPFDQQ